MDLRSLLMGLTFALAWSSAFTSARIIVAQAPPLATLSLRFLVSGLIGVLIARALGQTWRLSREQWRSTFIFGLCQNGIYLGLFFFAMTRIEASLASIIASTMPLMVALAGWMFMGQKLRPLALAGLAAGLGGVALIMGSRLSAGVDLTAVMLCVLGTMALTLATLSIRKTAAGGNLLMVVGLQMFVGAAALALVSLFTEVWVVEMSTSLVAAFVYTTIVPGLAATWIWFALVGRIGAVKAATFHFLNPFFGVAVAAVLLGEKLGPLDVVGVVIITLGILAVQLAKQERAPATS
ncbi:DMT family transporter [Candidatus Halocynthiibacter alkanivorans]|uniref:DMT family transporter n=1 Tax=Candidatus Halocynthiibacter alkanivorans TaxID=2267619 RepID=UPI000DF40237|nr:DMT family transporter [Candidatus Halocynthiibacter alkanivorans]